jgi:radical SAM-linked protein
LTHRIAFAVRDRARFLSHLETVDMLLSALRRAGYQIALSQGMKPRPVISLALPRAVGVESECELADVQLAADTTPEELAERLAPQLPAGVELVSVQPVDGRPAASRVCGARYRIEVAEDVAWDDAVDRFAAAGEATVVRRALGKADKRVDVKRFCHAVEHRAGLLTVEIEVTDAGTARPEEVATAVAAQVGATPTVNRLVRTGIELRPEPVGANT